MPQFQSLITFVVIMSLKTKSMLGCLSLLLLSSSVCGAANQDEKSKIPRKTLIIDWQKTNLDEVLRANAFEKIYDNSYLSQHEYFSEITDLDTYITQNLVPVKDMYKELRNSKVVLFADTMPSDDQQRHIIEIIKNIKSKNLDVGFDFFRREQQDSLDEFSKGNLSLDNLMEECRVDAEEGGYLGYRAILKFLGENKISAVGVDTFGILERFYMRDLAALEVIESSLSKNRQIFALINKQNCDYNHLPFLVEESTGIKPIIIVPLVKKPISGGLYYQNYLEHEHFKSLGLDEGHVIRYKSKNNFIIYFPNIDLQRPDFGIGI